MVGRVLVGEQLIDVQTHRRVMSSDEGSLCDELDYHEQSHELSSPSSHHFNHHEQHQHQLMDNSVAAASSTGTSTAVADAASAAGISDIMVGIDTDEYLDEPMPPVFEDTKLKPRHPCSVCRQCFALRSTWYDHMRQAHNITKPFSCDECPKRYSMLGALNYHRLTTHRGVVHACKTCGKRFMTKPGLVRHAKSHFGGVYLCEDCSKTFPTRDSLRRHRQQVHMGEKPHVCQYCQERFGASHSLKRHIKRRHSSNTARSSSHMQSGAATAAAAVSDHGHSRLSHTCTVCHKAFFSSEALRKHVQSMHQHARYQCETCLRRFSDWSNLNRHRKATKGCMPVLHVDSCDTSAATVVTSSTVGGASEDVLHEHESADCYSLVSSSDQHYDAAPSQHHHQPSSTGPIVIQHLALQPTTQLQLQLATADGEQLVLPASAVTALEAASDSVTCIDSRTSGDCGGDTACQLQLTADFSSSVGGAGTGALAVQCDMSLVHAAASSVSPSQSPVDGGGGGEVVCSSVDTEVELAASEFSQHYGTTVLAGRECCDAALSPVSASAAAAAGGMVAVSAGDHVELQPVNAVELQTLEAAVCASVEDGSQHTLLVPVTLATATGGAGTGGQDVYVTLYPADGDGSGHRFICVQNGDGAVLTELPIITEQILDVN